MLLVDSTKFRAQSSMILAPLARAQCIITDERLTDADRRMIEEAGVALIVADMRRPDKESSSPSMA